MLSDHEPRREEPTMAIPWLTALKVIPWGDVIEHAPKVLKGARRLLDRQQQHGAATPNPADGAAAPSTPAALQARCQALEQALRQTEADLTQLTATVAELAEHNARLVQAVDLLRWRTRWLALACLGLLAGLVGLLAWVR
jgi:hypothetical protein